MSERTVVLLVGAVQFINILDFMMVMPLGPDFAAALAIPTSRLGWVGAAYTFAAFLAALFSARHLDRFDRRSALLVASLGLSLGTLAGALAWDLYSLLAARLVAGAFGGPATALAIAIVIDRVPEQRRGRAMGAVMSAFSVASVLGVPASLEIARLGGWQAPFIVIGAAAAVVGLLAWWRFPPMREHIVDIGAPLPMRSLLRRREVRLGLSLTAVSLISAFLLIPHISTYLQFNLGVEREQIGTLYLVGGIVSYFGIRHAGRLADRWGPLPLSVLGTALMVAMIWLGFGIYPAQLPVMVVFVLLMLAMTARNVNLQTLNSKVPGPRERAAYMALNNAVQNIAITIGALVSTLMLVSAAGGALTGMPLLVGFMTVFALAQPVLIWRLQKRLDARRAEAGLR